MVASRNYESYVKASVEAGADAIISGAGLPLDLPKYAEDKIMLAPIVSSARHVDCCVVYGINIIIQHQILS